jgi:hypothetical protein
MKFSVGDKVEDRDTHEKGMVVHCFEGPQLRGIVAVQFDCAVACHVDDLRRARWSR